MITVEIYKGKSLLPRKQQWRWRATSTNGNIIAVSSESYTNHAACEHAVTLIFGPGTPAQLKTPSGHRTLRATKWEDDD